MKGGIEVRQILRFLTMTGSREVSPGNTSISVFFCGFGCWSLFESPKNTFFKSALAKKPHTCHCNFDLVCHSDWDISIFSFVAMLLFLVVIHCHNCMITLVWAGRGRKPKICRWNFDAVCDGSTNIRIPDFGSHLQSVLLLIWETLWACHGWKLYFCN